MACTGQDADRCLAPRLPHARPPQAGHTRNERRTPYNRLRTPRGETFQFTFGARKGIPRSVLDRIQALNALDEELWRAGDAILTVRGRAGRGAGRAGRAGALGASSQA